MDVVDDDSKFDENGEKFSKGVENWEKKKLFVISNFWFSHRGFKRLVLHTHVETGVCLGKG